MKSTASSADRGGGEVDLAVAREQVLVDAVAAVVELDADDAIGPGRDDLVRCQDLGDRHVADVEHDTQLGPVEPQQELGQLTNGRHRHARLGLERHLHAAARRLVQQRGRAATQTVDGLVRAEARGHHPRPERERLGAQLHRDGVTAPQQIQSRGGAVGLVQQRGVVLPAPVEHEARAGLHGHREAAVGHP